MSKNQSSNLLYLDGLRALAALYILFHHAVLQYYEFEIVQLTGIKKASVLAFFYGHLAVNLFIVLSGYCLMLPIIRNNFFLDEGSLMFYKKRVIRILPSYYLAILLSFILIWLFIGNKTGTHWDSSIPVTFFGVFTHIFLINDIFQQYTFEINHSLWSIPVESRIYIFFPILVFLWRKIGPVYTLLTSVLFSFFIYVILLYLNSIYGGLNLALSGVNPYIILFTLGMLGAHFSFYSDNFGNWYRKISWGTLFIISLLIFATIEKINQDSISKISNVAFGVCCFIFLVLCSKREKNLDFSYPLLVKVLSCQPLVFLGSFSYSLYLIHAPLLQILSQYIIDPLHFSKYSSTLLLILLSLLLILPLSYLFFLLCEKPFFLFCKKMNIKQTKFDKILKPAP